MSTDPHLDTLRGVCADLATALRDRPRRATPAVLAALAETDLGRLAARAGFGDPSALPGAPDLTTAVGRVALMEACARVDANAFMMLPGPSMSGVLVGLIGDEDQVERYGDRLAERPCWTFFGLTEPEAGTNAFGMRATARREGDTWVLDGVKCYVGNAARAAQGVVFARTGEGPFSIEAFLVDPGADGFTAEPLPMRGMAGAEPCLVRLDGVRLGDDDLLGRRRRSSRRGMRAAVGVFERLRPGVAALALGIAARSLDLLAEDPSPRARALLEELRPRLASARGLVLHDARAVDRGAALAASYGKVAASRLAWRSARALAAEAGPDRLAGDRRVLHLLDDAWAVQFMEGTDDVQLMQAAPSR